MSPFSTSGSVDAGAAPPGAGGSADAGTVPPDAGATVRHAGSRTLPREGPKLTGRAAALLIAITMLTLLALVPARQWLDQRSRIGELERRTAELQEQNADLRRRISELHEPAELERLARECLGMVAPGETALVIPGEYERADC